MANPLRAPVFKWKCSVPKCRKAGIGITERDAQKAKQLHEKAAHGK